MKQLGWILLGLVAGVLVGGVKPRAELAVERELASRLQDELVRAQSKASRCGRGAGGMLPGIGSLLPETSGPAPEEEGAGTGARRDGAVASAEAHFEVVEPDTLPTDDGGDGTGGGTGGSDASFNAAVEAQQLRAEQSRAALAEQAGLDDGDLAEVDAIVLEMNERLAVYADELVAIAEIGDDPSPRTVLGLTHEVSGILLDSQEALEETVGAERMQDVDPSTAAVWNQLDLGVMRDAVQRADGGG